MSDNLPVAVWSGVMKVGDLEIGVHVLDDGRRIIDADGMNALFSEASVTALSSADVEQLASFARGVGLPAEPEPPAQAAQTVDDAPGSAP